MDPMDSRQSPFNMKIFWPLLLFYRMGNNDGVSEPRVEFQMGVRNEVVQSVGKGQVHADSLSLAIAIPFFPVCCWGNQGKGCYFCCRSHWWPRLNIHLKNTPHLTFSPRQQPSRCCAAIWYGRLILLLCSTPSQTTVEETWLEVVTWAHYFGWEERKAAKKQSQTNGSGSFACRGTGLLGKLQFPSEPLCHVLRLSVTRPGCLCRSSSRRAEPGLTWNEPGISGSVGNFIYTWLIGTVGLQAVVTGGYGYRWASLLPCATWQNWG